MQPSVKVALSDDFLRAFAAIPRERQQAVMRFVAQFRHNPTASSINYEKLRDAADPNMRSVRIDQQYRGIVLRPERGDVYCLLWVDKHDDAYDWARRHKVAVNPALGNIQIFEVSHAVDPTPSPDIPASLFAALKDRELQRLGVPAEMLSAVRAVTAEDELMGLQSRLPDDAFEALFYYLAGESYEQLVRDIEAHDAVDTRDFAGALEHDASKRHFLVLTEDSDLEGLLAAPLALWRVFLHPSQRRLVERDWNGPMRVLGGAGTGKTVVAMHRAVWLARQFDEAAGKPVLFTTFTRTLADDIREQIAMIASPAERERIEVVNIDHWAVAMLRRFGYRQAPLFDERRRREFWEQALTRKPDDADYPDAFYRAEFERVVLPQNCETQEDYMRARRVGRGVQLSRPRRRDLWPVFAEYRAQLRAANLREPEEAYRDARALLERENLALGIRAIVVDETQDLSAAALALLRACVPAGANDLFLVGDAHQRIYRHKVVLSQVGIDIRGRGRRLRINYRTTDEIRRWATAQLADCAIDDLDGQPDSLSGYQSLTHGTQPEVLRSTARTGEQRQLVERIRALLEEGFSERGICVVLRTNEEAAEYEANLRANGLQVLLLDRKTSDLDDLPGIRVATMHRVKGLEFDAVVVAGYRGPEYLAGQYTDDADAGVMLDTITSERCLLHVAATRAKRHLIVSYITSG